MHTHLWIRLFSVYIYVLSLTDVYLVLYQSQRELRNISVIKHMHLLAHTQTPAHFSLLSLLFSKPTCCSLFLKET